MPLVPIEWLARHVEVPADLTPQQLAHDLVKVGLEEEAIHPGAVTGPVVVGRVLTREPKLQSNGKTINYCRVDVGQYNDEPGTGKEPSDLPSRGIICGAHNFEVGDYVVVSLPGAVLPGDFVISARKTYGHISDGMMCSDRELGLSDEHEGIHILAHPSDAETIAHLPRVGENVLPYLGIAGETLEINITPDRGYAFSMRGVAREYHHSTGAVFTDPGLKENAATPIPEPNDNAFPVSVEDHAPIHGRAGVNRFVTRIVRGIDPDAASPAWMVRSLEQAGMRSISLAVDATNYVMLDLGQPLHAYDLDKVVAPIVVRRAEPGEQLRTLDNVDRTLDSEDLLITDSQSGHGTRVLGLAGVMGGADTEISSATVNVLIESANFDPVSIARTARRHKLPSEASKRFERGVDPLIADVAAQAVVDILVEYGSGTASEEVGDYRAFQMPEAQEFPVSEVERLTSLRLADDRIREILEDIGCTVDGSGAVLSVTPPTWRPDLVGPAHFVEEIARLVGYDEIPSIMPSVTAGHGMSSEQRSRSDAVRALAEHGWVQVYSYPFVSAHVFDVQELPEDDPRRTAIKLVNPLQDEAPYMRTSLLDTLLDTARVNVSRSNATTAIFEEGVVTHPAGIIPAPTLPVGSRPADEDIDTIDAAVPAQPDHIAGVAAGTTTVPQAGIESSPWDWRDAIEAALTVARTLGVHAHVTQTEHAPWHPGRAAAIVVENDVVGYAGELAPSVCRAYDLPKRAVAFEVDVDALLAYQPDSPVTVRPVWTYPLAKEDIALVVDESVAAGDVQSMIVDTIGDELEDVRLFDVYRGEQIGADKKSLAFALRLRADHTITAEETAQVRKRIVKKAKKQFHAQLRTA
ncbi:MAG: phenylalanine--tRNA ligase subunit beta [Actinomycetaceae bacterium]|nr:phenylalanine--tRNA ligase subunit beta [Actinomycetaceae bacterium]MDY6083151.1 phenylalanine--tRNA ligase subunit beta [Actinomycetaceae bacterium]